MIQVTIQILCSFVFFIKKKIDFKIAQKNKKIILNIIIERRIGLRMQLGPELIQNPSQHPNLIDIIKTGSKIIV